MIESSSAAAVFAAALVSIGACAASWLLVTDSARSAPRAALAIAPASAAALAIALAARLVAHTQAAFDEVTPHGLSVIALESRWGGGWRLQMAAAAIALAVALWDWRRRRSGRVAAAAASLAVAFSLPLTGHSAAAITEVSIAGLHVLAAGAWLGTLSVLVMSGMAPRPTAGSPSSLALFHRFSPLATAGAAIVAMTGAAMAWRFVGSPRAVFESAYGRLFAVKCGVFVAVCLCGALNWRATRRGATLVAPRWELAFAALIVVVTGWLTETAHP